MTDDPKLTPTAELILEVLAARQQWLDKLNERLEPYRSRRRTSAPDEPRPRRSPG